MTSGIYKIQNWITQELYIGSSKDLKRRLSKHKSDLKGKRHHCNKLQNSWNKYGSKYFTFEVVEICSKKELLTKEQRYIDVCSPLYNSLKIVVEPGSFERTPEYCEAVRQRMLKRGAPANLLISCKTANIGRKHDQKFKDTVSKNLHLRYSNPEILQKQIEIIDRIRPRTKIKVTDVFTKEIWNFKSMTEAAKYFNVSNARVFGFVYHKRSLKARLNKVWEKV